MNLDEFMHILEQDVEAFEEYWRKQHADCSEIFPIELDDIEDWYDQFDSFTVRVD